MYIQTFCSVEMCVEMIFCFYFIFIAICSFCVAHTACTISNQPTAIWYILTYIKYILNIEIVQEPSGDLQTMEKAFSSPVTLRREDLYKY